MLINYMKIKNITVLYTDTHMQHRIAHMRKWTRNLQRPTYYKHAHILYTRARKYLSRSTFSILFAQHNKNSK